MYLLIIGKNRGLAGRFAVIWSIPSIRSIQSIRSFQSIPSQDRFKGSGISGNGNSPSPLIPFDRLTTPLSLGGARKIKERVIIGLKPQVPGNQALSIISFFSLFVCFVIAERSENYVIEIAAVFVLATFGIAKLHEVRSRFLSNPKSYSSSYYL
jgi:hypothetical protein